MYIDYGLCAKGFRSGDKSDVWSEFWRLIDLNNASLTARLTTAQGIDHFRFIIDHGKAHNLDGNAFADKPAYRASEDASLDRDTVRRVLDLYANSSRPAQTRCIPY